MDYHFLREFADSWGLLFLTLSFVGIIIFVFRPAGRKNANEAAYIPFKED